MLHKQTSTISYFSLDWICYTRLGLCHMQKPNPYISTQTETLLVALFSVLNALKLTRNSGTCYFLNTNSICRSYLYVPCNREGHQTSRRSRAWRVCEQKGVQPCAGGSPAGPPSEDSMGSSFGRTGIEFRAENTGDTATKNKPARRDAARNCRVFSCNFCDSPGVGLQAIVRPGSSTGRVF